MTKGKQIYRIIIIILICFSTGFTACKNPKKEISNLDIAKQYYKVLDNSETSIISSLVSDSIVIIESEYNYVETLSNAGYFEWLRWDSVFKPTYNVLQIEEENGMVKAKISKIDKRIFFLHEEPIVTDELIRFDNDKIISVEKNKYVVFNESKFLKNKDSLLTWIDKNHPDLNGFIYDQTKAGGIKYLKALALYKNRK